MPESVNVW
jgi:hypothetical protein